MNLTLHDAFKVMNGCEQIEVILDPPHGSVISMNIIYCGDMAGYTGENYPIYVMFQSGSALVFVVNDFERTN